MRPTRQSGQSRLYRERAQASRIVLGRQGRIGRNQKVASVALFLASDHSSYLTGDGIFCNGGQHVA